MEERSRFRLQRSGDPRTGHPMTPESRAKLLASKAAEDIYVLTRLCDDPAASDSVWGFHAQQAVEKLLKASLAGNRLRFPFTHRLHELADLMEKGRNPL